jgi:integrase
MLRLDPVRKTYSAEIKHRTFGRIHIRLRTKVHTVAMARHTALQQLLDTGHPVRDLVEALKARKLTIEAVAECVRAKQPFDALRPSTWPTLGEARDRYLKALTAREGGSVKTTANASTALDHAVMFFGASKPLEAITADDVTDFKKRLSGPAEEGGLDLHSNTVGLYLVRLGALYTFLQERETKRALQQKRVPATLFSPIDAKDHIPKPVQTRVRHLTPEEAQRVLTATPERLRLAVALGIYAGLRVGEVRELRSGLDVNLDRSVIYVQAREGWQPKYGKNREVPIGDALRTFAEAHLATIGEGVYLFPGQAEGEPISVHQLQHVFTRVVTDTGLEAGRSAASGVTFHTLRHTFASWLVMAGADLLTISRLMGHKSIKQIQDTYGHLSPGHLLGTVNMLSRYVIPTNAEPTPKVHHQAGKSNEN